MNAWVIPMLTSGGLFAGGASFFAWGRIPAWRSMAVADFEPDFARSVRGVDRIQPALLLVALVSTIGFALNASGTAQALSTLAAAGLLLTLVGSGAALVPLQRRLIAGAGDDVERLRRRWYGGHLLRTALALTSFILVAGAAAL